LFLDRTGKILEKYRVRSLLVWESLDPTDSRTAMLIDASKETGHLSHSISSNPGLVSRVLWLLSPPPPLLLKVNEQQRKKLQSNHWPFGVGKVDLGSSSHELTPKAHF